MNKDILNNIMFIVACLLVVGVLILIVIFLQADYETAKINTDQAQKVCFEKEQVYNQLQCQKDILCCSNNLNKSIEECSGINNG